MSRSIAAKITTKGGHRPRARIHATWSPIGQKMRRTAMFRGLGAVLAVLLVIGFAAHADAQTFFHSPPSVPGLDTAGFPAHPLLPPPTPALPPHHPTPRHPP